MHTDPVLAEKERVRKELCRKADYDINRLFENIHKNAVELAKKANTVLKYSKRKGGYEVSNTVLRGLGAGNS